ncbi:hypothetical protein HJC23_003384 [Cyclotella cryptica]|uniref:Uncharacterized protein n=1 Tax=Cyclotella cryptica TaxID=29204 RepID=A0ABD3QZL9_9STRA|eukprot:CCRYP_000968-RA/>CCRYP_000968-RA protein AED:0.04 eAED:-0.04 QI:0/-1/0/1/-1/1/1/0/206
MTMSFIKPENVDDDGSVATKNTQLTSGTASSRRTVRSAANKRKKEAAERRLVIRDLFANIFDLVGDWAFFLAVYNRDFDGDGEGDQFAPVEVQYRLLIHAVFAFSILGSTLVGWFVLTSIWRKTGMNSMCCNCTQDRIVLASILLEDIPQILLSVYMDHRFVGTLTPAGMLNICSSVNGLVNRLTSHYEEIKEDVFVIVDSYKEMP